MVSLPLGEATKPGLTLNLIAASTSPKKGVSQEFSVKH